MSIVRETATVDPMSSEELDIEGNIHRYNFGWMVTRTIVSLDDGTSIEGDIVEETITGISGNDKIFYEKVSQEILPPGINTPTGVELNTDMEDSASFETYFRFGRKKRVYTKAQIFGTSKIVTMGESQFSINESKEYANVIATSETPSVPSAPANDENVTHADGGARYTIANGVKTMTDIKG